MARSGEQTEFGNPVQGPGRWQVEPISVNIVQISQNVFKYFLCQLPVELLLAPALVLLHPAVQTDAPAEYSPYDEGAEGLLVRQVALGVAVADGPQGGACGN